MPAAHSQDKELANAVRFLAGLGYIMTDTEGRLVGTVATARQTTEESARTRRAGFPVIENTKRRG